MITGVTFLILPHSVTQNLRNRFESAYNTFHCFFSKFIFGRAIFRSNEHNKLKKNLQKSKETTALSFNDILNSVSPLDSISKDLKFRWSS